MTRTTITVAGVVALALSLGACAGVGGGNDGGGGGGNGSSGDGGGGTPSGALRIMGFGGEDEVATARVDAFTKAYPGVKVTHPKGDFDAQQFLTALASGNPPDLVYMDRALIGTYAAKGAVQPLEDCIGKQQIDTAQYRRAALASVTLKGKVYGIPEFYVVVANLIDTSVLKSAGLGVDAIQTKDWDALEQTAQKLAKVNGSKIQRLGYDPKMPDAFPLWSLVNGATLVKDDGAPNLADPKAVEALRFTTKLVADQGGWSNLKSFRDAFDIFGEKNPLTVHSITAFPMENWYVNVLTDYRGKGLQLGATPLTDRSGTPVSTLGGSAWAIPKGAKNPDAACAWAKTMTATETWMAAAKARQDKVAKEGTMFTGLFTANQAADEKIRETYVKKVPDAGFDQAISAYYEVLDRAKALTPSPAGAEIDAAWKSAVSRALGGQDAKAALDQAQKEAQTAFDKASRG